MERLETVTVVLARRKVEEAAPAGIHTGVMVGCDSGALLVRTDKPFAMVSQGGCSKHPNQAVDRNEQVPTVDFHYMIG